MQNIKFIQKEMNFTFEFNSSELFHEIDNYLIFKIIFPERANFYWIFGKPWFEKYLMVFNQDKKTIGHYCYILNDSDTKKISPTLNPLLLTIIFILLIILIILVSAFYYCINNSRRRRLNEVNDDYEYNNQNNDNLIN